MDMSSLADRKAKAALIAHVIMQTWKIVIVQEFPYRSAMKHNMQVQPLSRRPGPCNIQSFIKQTVHFPSSPPQGLRHC